MWPFRRVTKKRAVPTQAAGAKQSRLVIVQGRIDKSVARPAYMQILKFASEDQVSPIHLIIDSDGGTVVDVLAIYNVMRFLKQPVETHCPRYAAGGAVLLLAAGTPGQRTASTDALIELTQLDCFDSTIPGSEIAKTASTLVDLFAQRCGQPLDRVAEDISSHRRFDASSALTYGFIDRVVG